MIFFPAIDIKDGHCVRLLKGDMNSASVFNENPGEQAASFEASGCKWIHLVDLDGASQGTPVNEFAINSIINNITIPIELGGGIRNRETIEKWLEKGIERVILGTMAVSNHVFVRETCRAYPNKIAVGIDARNGQVAIEGWAKTSEIDAIELAKRFENAGVSAIIYTDIDRDGVMKGPNIEDTLEIARTVSTPVIASGGISSMADLVSIKKSGDGLLEGVIAGRAIYAGLVDPAEATILMDSPG